MKNSPTAWNVFCCGYVSLEKEKKKKKKLQRLTFDRERRLHPFAQTLAGSSRGSTEGPVTSLLLERGTVLACCSLQTVKAHPVRRPADEEHESFCSDRAVPLPRLRARRATSTMLHSTFSGTELLLRSQRRTSPVQNIRKSSITTILLAGLFVLVLIWAALAALRTLPERQVVVGLQHPVITSIDLAIFSFDNINAPKPAAGVGFPALASGVVGRREAFSPSSCEKATRRASDDQEMSMTN
ncbi:hypothetical protein HPB51_000436 [Rhipicephalus microplus]|uniref:Transmembrane protein n=1 Tax=Rhipicephalus microplus TaxID=6941 RepID=A0A9J6DRD5_RHIMP|nr:hypothetical protein HPB51_000436 [Rhipicephalus microplus]